MDIFILYIGRQICKLLDFLGYDQYCGPSYHWMACDNLTLADNIVCNVVYNLGVFALIIVLLLISFRLRKIRVM